MPRFTTDDGTPLFYTDTGTGAPVVLVPSAWLSSRMWEFQLPHLAANGLRAVAYDRRGHGRSDWTWHGYDYDRLADDLAGLLNHLDLRDVTLATSGQACGLRQHRPHRPTENESPRRCAHR
jgi:non-heme chloroperoxidase